MKRAILKEYSIIKNKTFPPNTEIELTDAEYAHLLNFNRIKTGEKTEHRPINGRHRGKNFLILGNAPCVINIKNRSLKNVITIGVNRILEVVKTDYLLFLDNVMEEKVRGYASRYNVETYCPQRIKTEENYIRFRQYIRKNGAPVLSLKFEDGLFWSRTSVMAAVNLAYIFGASQIGLFGVELLDNSHFYSMPQNIASAPFSNRDIIIEDFRETARFMKKNGVGFWSLSKRTALKDIEYKRLNYFLGDK